MDKIIPAGEFKQTCLAILDEVERSHQPVTITKRGRPVARLVPLESAAEREEAILAELRARTRVTASEPELLRPSSEEVRWRSAPPARKKRP